MELVVGPENSDHASVINESISRVVEQVHYNLTRSTRRENTRRVVITLDTSQQKFQIWKSTWVDKLRKTEVTFEILWGEQGSADVQRLLHTVCDTTRKIEELVSPSPKARSRSQSRIRRVLKNLPTKDGQNLGGKGQKLLDLAVELSTSIDILWTYSDFAFDSLHGLLSRKSGSTSRDQLLTNAIQARSGSLALYHTCISSGLDCNLDLNLFGDEPGVQKPKSPGSPKTSIKLAYHLITQTRDSLAQIEQLTVENFADPQPVASSDAFYYNASDTTFFESNVQSKTGILDIHSQYADSKSYFHIVKPSTGIGSKLKSKTLTHILQTTQKSQDSTSLQLSSVDKIDLAFKLVECGLYLLGSPWLASLSSRTIQSIETDEGRHPFVLEIQTLDVEDLAFEEPNALAESTQLFRIGVVLMKLALGETDGSDPATFQEPYLETSKLLPRVEQSMGPQYCKATAFCLQDRRSALHFAKPNKYLNPKPSGWTAYLAGFLEDYYVQVFLR